MASVTHIWPSEETTENYGQARSCMLLMEKRWSRRLKWKNSILSPKVIVDKEIFRDSPGGEVAVILGTPSSA
jgi:hypothetical protein